MTAFEKHKEKLADLEFMMGKHRGRLAMAMDLLTDAIVLSGQHGIYCKASGKTDQPNRDLRELAETLNQTKQLIQNVLHELKGKK